MEEEQKEKIISEPSFDLYTHMKVNIKCSSSNCEIHDSDFTHYCFTCRRPVCEICKESFHSSHPIQHKGIVNFDISNLNEIFSELDKSITKSRILTDPKGYKDELKSRIISEFEEIENLILGLKKRKLQEIDHVFSEAKDSSQLNKLVKESRKSLFEYFHKYKETYYNSDIKDEDNAIFLQTYDLYNLTITAATEYIQVIKSLTDYYKNYEKGIGFKYQGVKNEIEKSLEEERKSEILFNNLYMFDMNSNNQSMISQQNTTPTHQNQLDMLSNLDKKNSNTIINVKEKESKIKPFNNNQEVFRKEVSLNFEKLGEDFFKDLRERVNKTAEFMDVFRKMTFESFKKHGSLIDIEKTVKLFDEKTNKRTNFIKGKAKLNFSPSQAKAYSTSGMMPQGGMTRSKNTLGISTPIKRDSGVSNASKNSEKVADKDRDSSSKSNSKEKNNTENSGSTGIPSQQNQKLKHFTGTGNIKDMKLIANDSKLECLREELEDDDSEAYEGGNTVEIEVKQNDSGFGEENLSDSSDYLNIKNDENDSVKLENGYGVEKKFTKEEKKLAIMFKPKKRKVKTPIKPKINLKSSGGMMSGKLDKSDDGSGNKYKVNNKLQEMIKENQKLCAMIKKKDDITLAIPLIRRYYSYMALEFIRKNFFKFTGIGGGHSQNILEDTSQQTEEELMKDSIKLFEGCNEIQIYCREKRKLIKTSIILDKKLHGITHFPSGARTFYTKDRVYITGGKDCNQEYKLFMFYSIKENKLVRLPDMVQARSYHTMVYHENLKSILVFGGENNKTCEMFDFFLNAWSEIPELNLPRANISIFIDKIGTFAYAFCGTVGPISTGLNSDAIELLDLVDMNQGWAKVEYCNKANVDFKFSHTGVYPLTDDKILIYGAAESRKMQKCFVVFNLRTFDVTKVSRELLESLRLSAMKNPELSRIFL